MHAKQITYTDFAGSQRTETFYFNLSKSELYDMQLLHDGNIQDHFNAIVASNKGSVILPEFKALLKKSYGERSDDGKYFVKNDEVWARFENHAAYDELLFELYTKADEAAKFFSAIVPQNLIDELKNQTERPADQTEISRLAREQSEAAMQGHRPAAAQPQQTPQPPRQPVYQPTEPVAPRQPPAPPTPEAIPAIDLEAFQRWQAEQHGQQSN